MLPSSLSKMDRETRKKIDLQVHKSLFWHFNVESFDLATHEGPTRIDSLKEISKIFGMWAISKVIGEFSCAFITRYKFVDGKVHKIEDDCRDADDALFRHIILLASGFEIANHTNRSVTYVRKRSFGGKSMDYATNHSDEFPVPPLERGNSFAFDLNHKYCNKPTKYTIKFDIPFKVV